MELSMCFVFDLLRLLYTLNAEASGFLFDVAEIVKETQKSITVRLCSDFSSIQEHWTIKKDGTPGGVLKTFRKSTKIYGIV